MDFIPTREAGLERLEAFVPKAAKYAGTRNFDLGAENHQGVSQLSPYIRTRLITEEEATRAVLQQHSPRAAEKFLQEIAWRTYWKGWLEMRPQVWSDYQEALSTLSKSAGYDIAVSGKTGIGCFDHWVGELLETGYLHNHTRMWFASIWIFTLKLPWQLGADFFLHHLLDADPAANTLSWRWVAGLHTPGKHYVARAWNIEKYTNGRFNPIRQLDEDAKPIAMDRTYERQALELPENPKLEGRIGHLMFPEDLAEPPGKIGPIAATAAFIPESLKTSKHATDFLQGAIATTLDERGGVPLDDLLDELKNWILAEKLDHIIYSLPTVGPTKDDLSSQKLPKIAQPFVRDWDRDLWPKAMAGFFKLKEALPKIFGKVLGS